jgi:uncharacterized membrane protein YgaE (UPF0421/DUF939 family)
LQVIGYSYQDHNIVTPGNPGFGWEVAWRRFILVTVGVLAAGLFSLLPPSTTIRHYERTTMATTASEIGTMYCDIISYANIRRDMDPQEIVTGLIAIRSKILRSITLKSNAIYEVHFHAIRVLPTHLKRAVFHAGKVASETISKDHGVAIVAIGFVFIKSGGAY